MDNPYGVLEFLHWDHPWSNRKYKNKEDLIKAVELMRQAGVGWVRMDFLWEDIEPKEKEFNFSKYDYIVDLLRKNNIHVLGLLNYSVSWASSRWNIPPQDERLFVDYAVTVIDRYKDRIKYWEVWNEPDSSIYWKEQDGLKSYCRLLQAVYLAAKKTDPDCKILNGGLSQGLSSINKLYDNGAKDYFDILNLHFFETPLKENAINSFSAFTKVANNIMSRNGDAQKKIWISEIGCPGVMEPDEIKNWWLGKNPTEAEQASWLREVYAQLDGSNNVEKIFWAFFRDCKGHWDNGVDYFGLVRWDFSLKPGFTAFSESAKNRQQQNR